MQSLGTIRDTGGNITFFGFSLQWWICDVCCHLSSLINPKLLVLAFMVLQHVAHPSVPLRVSYFIFNSYLQSASSPTWPLSRLQKQVQVLLLVHKEIFHWLLQSHCIICLYIPHKSLARRAHKAQTYDIAHYKLWVMSAATLFSVIMGLFQTILFSYFDKLLGSQLLSSEI